MCQDSPPIRRFTEEHRWLSNFAPAPVKLDGVEYPTVEHAYQAAKTLDTGERANIRQQPTPGKAKRAGRRVTLRSDWASARVGVMGALLRQKFSTTPYQERLQATGDCLIEEGNTWGDTFWGVSRGQGQNKLGKLIMAIRELG